MSNCCHPQSEPPEKPPEPRVSPSCCAPAQDHGHDHEHHHAKGSFDYLLWGCLSLSLLLYLSHWLAPQWGPDWFHHLGHGVFDLLNTMWWGVLVGALFVGLLSRIPQNLVLLALGQGGSINGLWRATLAGVCLDLCSHGILMVGSKLYQKGASLGQVMAFLIASPWNSFSLTLIMIALMGLKWTLAFILLSVVIALVSGWLFDRLVASGRLPANPYASAQPLDADFRFWPEAKRQWQGIEWRLSLLTDLLWEGIKGSRMVLRWLLFGVLLAAMIRAFVSVEIFQQWFGPSLVGLAMTLIAATIIEVCSEGSTPIAADLMSRAQAPGNAFAFMMAGVATDYTEVMVLRETTRSWKIALFMPLITLPQVILLSWLLNQLA